MAQGVARGPIGRLEVARDDRRLMSRLDVMAWIPAEGRGTQFLFKMQLHTNICISILEQSPLSYFTSQTRRRRRRRRAVVLCSANSALIWGEEKDSIIIFIPHIDYDNN